MTEEEQTEEQSITDVHPEAEDLIAVVTAMADFTGTSDDNCGCCENQCDSMVKCPFCYETHWGETHTPDCVVLKARKLKRAEEARNN